MAGAIQSLEIFGAGTHRASTGTVTITEDDLDKIVNNFTTLQGTNIVKPHLKLGHTDAQKWFGQQNGIPTLGWITKVWRQGKKLLANVEGVPDALLNLIRQGRYHNVSSEVYPPGVVKLDGKPIPGMVLSAVALLGTEMPAVKDLNGLAAALYAQSFESSVDAEPVTFTQETKMPDPTPAALFNQAQVDALIEAAVQKATKDFAAKQEAEIADLRTKLDVATKRADGAEASLKKFQADAAEADAVRVVDQAIKDGKMLPKQRDFALAFMKQAGAMIKFGDGEKSAAQLFQEFLGASGKVVDTSTRSVDTPKTEFASPGEEVAYKIDQKRKADPKLTYTEAYQAVLNEDPQLRARYAEATAA